MKTSNQFFSFFLSLLFVGFVAMSFTLSGEGNPEDEKTTAEVGIEDAKNHCCCPPGWTLAGVSDPNDPANARDNNGDGLVCAKGFEQSGHPSDGTPVGKGNYSYPDLNQSNINVKDNNKPCSDGEFNPCD